VDRDQAEPDEVFCSAVELESPAERAAYLDGACGDDLNLRRRVERLLEAHAQAGNFLAAVPEVAAATTEFLTEATGTLIGPYKLLEQIGEGGFGVVFMAEQQQPVRRKVALKVLKPGMDSRRVIARFEAERQALALMDHANIARVFDGGETASGRPYFVMELVKGVPITDYCDHNHLTPRERLELFAHVCQAVQHAHQKGIIHRDIKPSNVLVTEQDGAALVKVIDFGIAKALGQQLTDKTLFTGFAQLVGTPLYMSPEQAALSHVDVDIRSDIYSLGVLLYELLTGTTPFSTERLQQADYDEICRIIREEESPRPSTRISTLGQAATTISKQRKSDPRKLSQLLRGELDWMVMKALDKDRNRRYETASALAADVGRYLHHEPVEAGPPSALYRLRKFARRNRAALAVAAGVLLLLTALVGGVLWLQRGRLARERQAEAELGQVVRLRAEAAAAAAGPRRQGLLAEALATAERADGLLAQHGEDDELRQRVRQLVDELRAEGRDRRMLDRLREASLSKGGRMDGRFARAAAAEEYGQAFRDYGIDVSAAGAGEQLRGSAIAVELAAALDDWAAVATGKGEAARLRGLARQADADAVRLRLRAALERGDVGVLKDLARPTVVATLPVATANLLAEALTARGAAGEAERVWRQAWQRQPGDFWVNEGLGRLLLNAGPSRSEEAIRYLTAAVALKSDSLGAHSNLGIALADKGRLDEAIAACRKAIELKPDCAEAHSNLGNALRDKGRLDEAIAACRKAIELKADDAEAHNNLGNALRDKGRVDEAIEEHRKAIELNPDDAEAHSNLGCDLHDKGRLDEAIAECRKAIELKADYAVAHCNLGNALHDKGRLDEAIAECRKAIELKPDLAAAYCNLGCALGTKGWLDEAMAAFRKAIELNPDWALAHYNLGKALADKGRLDEAIAEYREAIRRQPSDANAHNQAAWFLATCPDAKLRDPKRAVELAKKAVTLAPNEGNSWNTLGVAHYRAGQWQRAVGALKKSMDLRKGGDSCDWLFLAMAHWQLGEKDQAQQWYDRAVQWMDKNRPTDEELRRFRAEAAELLQVKDEKTHDKDTKDTRKKP
jgi:tetratricopeptide (TPR) repeat protein/serine/threonine protein kinase